MNKCTHIVFVLFCLFNVSFSLANNIRKVSAKCGSYYYKCGVNAHCQNTHGGPTCTCLPNFKGDGYNGCHKTCLFHTDCANDKACVKYKCKDPCHATDIKCGNNAECKTYKHEATCTCKHGYTGNGYDQNGCIKVTAQENKTPCSSSPCGLNGNCYVQNDAEYCSCPSHLPKGDAWTRCYNACLYEHECADDKVCINDDCKDPCSEKKCGLNAECKASNHKARCSCLPGYSGNPHTGCTDTDTHLLKNSRPLSQNPCSFWPCGQNATCKLINGVGQCFCLSNLPYGNPYGAKDCYECLDDTNCADNKACLNRVCTDPCLGTYCDTNAECRTFNHKPQCMCLNPSSKSCEVHKNSVKHSKDPCHSSPCGVNAICNVINGFAVCSCKSHLEYFDPYRNRCYECLHDTNCAENKACKNNTCRDPCLETKCNIKNTECKTINHEALCFCIYGHTFDQQTGYCTRVQEPLPNPSCGSNAEYNVYNGIPYCSCPSDRAYGNPHVICFECLYNSHCADNKACVKNTCTDPCQGKCGTNAKCKTLNHEPQCTCLFGYTGNPDDKCSYIGKDTTKPFLDPCIPSPCSSSGICLVINGVANCTCPKNRPYGNRNGCYECLYNSHCADDKYCYNNKCTNPCLNICGSYTYCTPVNHRAHCNCITGYTGDPYKTCNSNEYISRTHKKCGSLSCGVNAVCDASSASNGPSCLCIQNFKGDPFTKCYECLDDIDCTANKVCVNKECKDPCLGKCGKNAECTTSDHNKTLCACSSGYTGDPLTECTLYTGRNIEDVIFQNVSVHVIPELNIFGKNVTLSGSTYPVEKLYTGAFINLTCVAENLPNGTSIIWDHYGNPNSAGSRQVHCMNKPSCRVNYSKHILKEDNNTVVRCAVLKNIINKKNEAELVQKYLISVLIVRQIQEETSPESIFNGTTELPSISSLTSAPVSEPLLPKQNSSIPLLVGSTVAGIFILIIIGIIIYWCKCGKKFIKQDQEPIYATPECHYAELSLPKSDNTPVGVERVQYAEVIGFLKPKK